MTEKRVKLSTIVKSQVPDYVRTDFPLITEFLKEYYRGQEYQGGPIDLIDNIDQYTKIDSFTNRVYSATLFRPLSASGSVIEISDTSGFPDSYGLIKINDEVITYKNKTPSSFIGCVRGFSGICDYTKENYPDEVLFESTLARSHKKGSEVLNLSVLFLLEFLNKTKKQIALGFDGRDFYSGLDQNNFLKQVRSFYASKGTEESFKILFKALYGARVKLVTPAEQLFRPSDAQFNKVESLVIEPTLNEDEFDNIQNITLFQDFPSKSYAPIAYSERIQTPDLKTYYRLDIDSGYNKDITFSGAIYGDFKVTPKTKLINPISIGATYLDVESTVGFAKTGNISFKYTDGTNGSLYYGSKTINQFRDINYIYKEIAEEENITDKDTFAYATINGKKVECNVSSIISEANYPIKSLFNNKDTISRVKTLGFEGSGFKFDEWFYNNKKVFTVNNISIIDFTDRVYRINLYNEHYLVKDDTIEVIDNSGVALDATILSVVNTKSLNVRISAVIDLDKSYTIKRGILRGVSSSFPQLEQYHANVQNVYSDDDGNLLVASTSLPSESISIAPIDLIIEGTFSGTDVSFTYPHNLKTGDKIYYYPEMIESTKVDEGFNYVKEMVEGTKLFDGGIYYVEKVDEVTVKFALSKENIFFKKYITFDSTTVKENRVRLYDYHEAELQDQKLLREIPVPLEDATSKVATLPGTTGMLLNGVEILNYKSRNNIYYGEIKNVDVIFSDEQFDVINPPNLVVEDSSGSDAEGYFGITGSLSKIKLVNGGFDYEGTPTIKIKGGNGKGASVLVNMKLSEHVSFFNSRSIRLPEDIIGFSTYHKFRNFEEVVYQTSGQTAIAGLTTNTSYFVGLAAGTTTYALTVSSKTGDHPYFGQGSANGYYIVGGDYSAVTQAPNLQFVRGSTYIFDQNDISVTPHAVYFSEVETAFGGSDRYEIGVTYTLDGVNLAYADYISGFAAATNRSISITVANDAPATLYYTCSAHQYMGNAIAISNVSGGIDLNNIKLYNTRSDATSGINTVSLTAYGDGVHSLRAVNKKRQIDSINVVEPGEGYSNRKVTCSYTGINTATNTINSINHGYVNGDIVQYVGVSSTTETQLTGLSLNTDYIATVIDNNNFTLSNIGVGNSINIFADRKEYIDITNQGTGTHIFNHPPIEVILNGKTGIGDKFVAELQPKFLGSINNIHISNGGVGYGVTNIQEFERNPIVTYSIGQGTQIKCIVNNGSITEAVVLHRGRDFTSAPDVVVDGNGTGAVLTATLRNDGTIDEVIVIEGGRGYSQNSTSIRIVSSESLSQSKFQPHLQSWKINLFFDNFEKIENDDGILTKSSFGNYGIQYLHLYAPRYLRNRLVPSDSEGAKQYGASDLPFNRVEIDSLNHSPIIGWAYDGNPIYGPYGYSKKSGGVAVRMKSGYYDDSASRSNRPPNYPSGYFVEDYTYYRVDDDSVLDENNGRYCVTPEFPKGTYAYFATINEIADDAGPFRDYRRPIFPYLIGDNYFSIPSKFNDDKNSNQDGFDLNQSEYKRNTTVYNFFDKTVNYPYINLSNNLNQKVTVKTVGRGRVSSIDVLNGGDFYKVNDRLVFDQENSGGKGVAAKVEFVEGKEVVSISCSTTEIPIEIYSTPQKGKFVGIATTSHQYFNNELISITNFSTVKSKFEGNYEVSVPATTFSLVGLGTTTHALDNIANTGISTYVYVSNLNFEEIRENDEVQINDERVKVINVERESGRIKILRESSGPIHTVGTAATIMQRKFFFNSDYDNSFKFRNNKEIYFTPSESIGLSLNQGTPGYPGYGTTVFFNNPGIAETSTFIKPRSIYLKNHGLKTGDTVKYFTNSSDPYGSPNLAIEYEDNVFNSGIGSELIDGRNYYVARLDKDHIGISTVIVGIGSTGVICGIAETTRDIGLIDIIDAGTYTDHSFVTQYPKITATAIKNRVTVSTATTHGLSSDHKVLFDIQPRVEKTVVVKYDDFNGKIIINPKSFEAVGVNTETGVVTIEDHGFSTGDKLIHTADTAVTAFDNNREYYAVKIDKDNFKVSTTSYNSQLDQPITVVGVATTAGTFNPVNPVIDTEGYSSINFDLTDSSLEYIYFQNNYPAFDLDFYVGDTFNKPWTKNPEDNEFKVVKTGIVGSTSIVKLFLDENTPKNLFYNLIPKYTQGVPLSDIKKLVHLDKSVHGAGSIKVSESSYSGSHKIKVSSGTTFSYNLSQSPEVVSYGSTNSTISYITDCTHTNGPISRVKLLNTGYNYNTLPGFSTVTTIDGVDAVLELKTSDIGKIDKVEITNYGFDFPYDQTIRPLFYYPQSLRLTPFSSIDKISITNFGRGYDGRQELVVIDGVSGEIVDDIDLIYDGKDDKVTILKNTFGMSDVIPKIYPVKSGRGIPVDTSPLPDTGITYDPLTKLITARLKTQYSSGDYFPFIDGEKFMIEGCNTGIGNSRGFNSSEFNYKLFTIVAASANVGGTGAAVTFSMADHLKPGEGILGLDKINSAPRLLPERDFPSFEIQIKKNEFIKNEIVKFGNKVGVVESWNEKDSILQINSTDNFLKGERVRGQTSKSIALIGENVFPYKSYGKYGVSINQSKGWNDIAGFLNNDLQRFPDNDYYQNFSYSLKSTIPLQTWNDPISSMNHVSGYKKFANYQLESYERGLKVNTSPTEGSTYINLIKDIVAEVDLNCVNDFDLVRENYINLENTIVSTEINFEGKLISSFDEAVGNRVLSIDDISSQFSHVPRSEEYVDIDALSLDNLRFAKYITLVRDKRFTSERQVSVFDVIQDGNYGYSNEYAVMATTDNELGAFDFNIADGKGFIRFYPTNEKVAYNDLNICYVAYKIKDEFLGVGNSSFGDVALVNTSSVIFNTPNTPKTVVSIANTYNSVSLMVMINPDTAEDNEEFGARQINFVHDGVSNIVGGEYGSLYTDIDGLQPANSGYGTFYPYFDGNNFKVDFTPNSKIGAEAVVNTIQIGIAQTATDTEVDYNMNHSRLQVESTNIPASSSPGITTVNTYRYIANSQPFHAAKYWIHVADKTNNEHAFSELFVVDTINGVGVTSEAFITEYGNLATSSGLGTFGAEVDNTGFAVDLHFTPEPNIDVEVNIFAHHLKSETADDVDTILDFNNGLITDDRDEYVGTFNAVKTDFDLTHEGQDIFEFWFDGGNTDVIDTSNNSIKLPNHFFISGERVKYFRDDINNLNSAIGIGQTFITGIGLTTILPNDVDELYIVKIDDSLVGLSTSPDDALLPDPNLIDINNVGSGTSHRLLTTRQNAKVLVTIDNIIQSPIVSTAITSQLATNLLSIDDIADFVGVTSFFGGDFFRINDEIMKVEGVGVGGISTKVRLRRARLGTNFRNHSAGDIITKISGNYNIIDSTISFAEPPFGLDPVSNPDIPSENDWSGIAKGSSFTGRSYMRGKISSGTSETYQNNYVFQDVSDRFNSLEFSFPLRTDAGNDITGIQDENAVILINNILQLPGITVAEDYQLTEALGITSAIFNGDARDIGYDVGISSFPNAGIIQSIGSTEGFGYHPLVSAAATATISEIGEITAVSVGDTGTGYRSKPIMEIITKTNYPISVGTTNIFIENKNSVFGILNEIQGDGTNTLVGIGTFKFKTLTPLNGIGNTFIQLRPVDQTPNDIPIGTLVSIGVTLPYGIVNVSAATSNISGGAVSGLTYDVLDADYNPETGFLSMTLPKNHELNQGDYISIIDNGLYFTCNSDGNTRLKSYPRPNLDDRAWNRPLRLENVEGSNIQAFVGVSTFVYFNISNAEYTPVTGITTLTIGANHGLVVDRGISLETDSLSFTCTMDGNTATKTYPRSTDPAANNTLDIINADQAAGTITVNVGASPLVYFTPSAATYTPSTGLLQLTIGSHTLTSGTSVRLADNSLTFTCALDGHTVQKTYPRASGEGANAGTPDAAYQTAVNITAVDQENGTITLDVGTSSDTSEHLFVTAAADAVISGGDYQHSFQSATPNALRAGGQYTHTFVGIGTSAVVSTATTSIQHVGFTTVIVGTGHISDNVIITNPGFNLNVGVGSNMVVPQIVFDEPEPYGNMPLIYSDDNAIIGLGTEARVDVQVGNGSSIISFKFNNNGYAYGNKDILTVQTGGLTGIPTYITNDFEEFQIEVDKTFDDTFNGWSLGQFEILDNINQYIDGRRLLFPLFRDGERLSIIASKNSKIAPEQLLLVFLNNTLQVPNISYYFLGGNRIRFTEAPRVGDSLRILYYKGNGAGLDVIETDVIQTVKEGDTLRITSDDIVLNENTRIIKDVVSTDTVETLPYFGPGNTDNVELIRPVYWCRQTKDKIIDGRSISKARRFYEPNIAPNATLIKSVGVGETVLHVDTVRPLFTQNNENDSTLLFQNSIIIHPKGTKVGAAATATVSVAGTVSAITITNGGEGYLEIPSISIASTTGVSGIGTTTTATATATLTGGVVTGITVSGGGVGYSTTSPPTVLISPPSSDKLEKNEVYYPFGYKGDAGSIVGFATTSIGSDTFALFDLFIPSQDSAFSVATWVGTAVTVSQIEVGDVFTIYNSNIGAATTSITTYDTANNVLGISTSFVDGVYEVLEKVEHPRVIGGIGTATVRVRAKVDNPPLGFDFDANWDGNTGMTTSNYQGAYSWGKIVLKSRLFSSKTYSVYNENGIGGISTSPTIIRTEPLKYVRYGPT